MDSFTSFLKHRLSLPLPGFEVQLRMAPPTDVRNKRVQVPPGVKHNGVVILIHKCSNEYSILMTLRSSALKAHSGQICFPGGGSEPYETLEDTVLRELEEETGLQLQPEDIIGRLTPLYVPPTENIIHPFVSYISELPGLTLQESEVSEAFPVSLSTLSNPEYITSGEWVLGSNKITVPYWNIHKVPLWGATAMITREFLELYEEFRTGEKQEGDLSI